MKHIHHKKIIHRDLKAQNIFLMEDDSIRLGDFGVAKVLDYTAARAQTQVGTPYYISPDILKGRAYTNKADVWSLGILLFELCALDVPIKAANLHDLYKKILNFRKVPPIPREYSVDMKQLIDSMLNIDASKRPSVNDLLAHKVIAPRISKHLSDEEQKKLLDSNKLNSNSVLGSNKARAAPRPPSGVTGFQARPYSARSGQSNRGRFEEAKQPASRLAGAAGKVDAGGDRHVVKPADASGSSKVVGGVTGTRAVDRTSAGKSGAK